MKQKATFWWRDDDATQSCQQLDKLLELSSETPLALAVIPMCVEPSIIERLAGEDDVTIMQHGFTHTNRAPEGEKKAEFGQHRPNSEMIEEITKGAVYLDHIFHANFSKTFVPPWNRITRDLIPHLHEAGISSLSSIGPCLSPPPLPQVNAHVDIIDWRGHRGFRGAQQVIRDVVNNLADRRLEPKNLMGATGLLTHHLNHDEACWSFIADLLALTSEHPAAHWTRISDELKPQ